MLTVFLSQRECMLEGLKAGQPIRVQAGTAQTEAVLKIAEEHQVKPGLSPALQTELHWPKGIGYQLRYSAEKACLLVGPLLGILAHRGGKKSSWGPHIRETQRYAHRRNVVTVVFSPRDICWEEGTVQGTTLGARGWTRQTFPIPKVIFNRIFSRKTENIPDFVECKARLQTIPGLVLYNPGYLDKWQTHQYLLHHPAAKALLPETIVLHRPEEIWPLVNKHRIVYVKPVHGSQGYGIYRISRRASGNFSMQMRGTSVQSGQGYSKEVVEKRLRTLMGKRTYVAQQGLRLATIKGAPFDLRLLMQKDGKGVWQQTKAFGRVAPPGMFTSNLSRGGTAMGLRHTLRVASYLRRRTRGGIIKELRHWGRLLPQIVEEATGKVYGELGLDLALDHRGRIWLIEINSKPHKRLQTEEGNPVEVRQSLERPILFGKYLDGFA
ncbi:YheC/YheD family protein [Heliophilum fasciatum]|uniref:YheC/D-like protein n=1 Tax=Heliophilum fasciatum TaxID=35700 RepID=A0A4R2RFB7_9FIRM|nr:YheC/YheD family protein [Heliophilum fasciatum]MCW2279200.1 hypothetical protein [Heliophilum fasciatum]TCP60989.1 YheC/D-like protein [Heliophilum fasciatum]